MKVFVLILALTIFAILSPGTSQEINTKTSTNKPYFVIEVKLITFLFAIALGCSCAGTCSCSDSCVCSGSAVCLAGNDYQSDLHSSGSHLTVSDSSSGSNSSLTNLGACRCSGSCVCSGSCRCSGSRICSGSGTIPWEWHFNVTLCVNFLFC